MFTTLVTRTVFPFLLLLKYIKKTVEQNTATFKPIQK